MEVIKNSPIVFLVLGIFVAILFVFAMFRGSRSKNKIPGKSKGKTFSYK